MRKRKILEETNMKKKIIAVVAIVALVAILGVCLVACNADSYKKKLDKAGYTVTVFEADDVDEGVNIEWGLYAVKTSGVSMDMVTVAKYKSEKDAKKAEERGKNEHMSTYRSGKLVIVGTEQGVKDAK